MDINKLIAFIDIALIESDNYVIQYYNGNELPLLDTKKVLNLLKAEALHHLENINERVLRAMHDVGMSSYKEFENTPLEKAINNVTEILYYEIPYYKNLEPLKIDFGKGDPI